MATIDIETTRTYSGEKNNRTHPNWGAANTQLLRDDVGHAYDDDNGESLARKSAPSPRTVSNIVCIEQSPKLNKNGLSDFIWAWGQFLDHEIDLTRDVGKSEPIKVHTGDNRLPTGGEIPFKRSNFDRETGQRTPREQINEISAYIDASNVYGSDEKRANALRAKDGTGKLKTSTGAENNLLPIFEEIGDEDLGNANPAKEKGFFIAGDIRVNEVTPLIAMHTLFLREHNRRCEQILARKNKLTDEEIYQRARRYVGALEQVITFEEFLPVLLGKKAIKAYRGYKKDVNAGISNLFSTAGYRFGHSMLSERIRVDNDRGSLSLHELFFTPSLIKDDGITPFLSGLAKQRMRNIDVQIVESVRSFLFHRQEKGHLLDLAALNIQRGRDHGLPDYNTCRGRLKLPKKRRFRDITRDSETAARLEVAYAGDIDAVDPWIGGLAEDHVKGSNVGQCIQKVLVDQFQRLRDGDRFWYQHDQQLKAELAEVGEDLRTLSRRKLSDVIRDNTGLQLQKNVFHI